MCTSKRLFFFVYFSDSASKAENCEYFIPCVSSVILNYYIRVTILIVQNINLNCDLVQLNAFEILRGYNKLERDSKLVSTI